jgi:dTDP-4-dehydrorhamnose reductase
MDYYRGDAIGWARADCDLSNPEAIEAKLDATDYAGVILSAAITSLEVCEQQPELAHQVNVGAAEVIAKHAARRGVRCLFVSTDYVYDGTAPGLRSEEDTLRPLSQYAATKLQGELATLAASPYHLVARTSWIFGPHRPGFVEQTLRQAREGRTIEAIADKYSAPSYAVDVAEAMAQLLAHPNAQGSYNVVNRASADVSWHMLGQRALELAGQAQKITPTKLADIRAFLAPRPQNTAATPSKLERLFGRPMRNWDAALGAYISTLPS